ncbi:hypothetical protein TKK_0002934 [Trichogramma kaykai]
MPKKITKEQREITSCQLSRLNKKEPPKKRSNSESMKSKKIRLSCSLPLPDAEDTSYKIINFLLVFNSLSTFVKCVDCGGKISFFIHEEGGLGFKVKVCCSNCKPRYINSSEKIQCDSYEINYRFSFIMRILGIGLSGCDKFCGLMDIKKSKTLDICVKSGYCQQCKFCQYKLDTVEFQEWKKNHVNNGFCKANDIEPSGNMEVSAIKEMFQRSQVHQVKYENYIGDSDSKTYSGVVALKPYGKNFVINKKECVGHVQKRMGKRLRDLVKNTVEEAMLENGKTIKKKFLVDKIGLQAK